MTYLIQFLVKYTLFNLIIFQFDYRALYIEDSRDSMVAVIMEDIAEMEISYV